jgi:hypothetical protein
MSVTEQQKARLAQIDLVIATPCYGGVVAANYTLALLSTVMRLQPLLRRINIAMIANESLVTRARNTLMAQFLADPNTTHLMFIDADVEWSPEAVLDLLLAEKEVVAGAYPMKTLNWQAMAEAARRGGAAKELRDWSSVYVLNFEGGTAPKDPGALVPVQDIGTGFLLIERGVLERMSAALPELRYRNTPTVQTGMVRRPVRHDDRAVDGSLSERGLCVLPPMAGAGRSDLAGPPDQAEPCRDPSFRRQSRGHLAVHAALTGLPLRNGPPLH